MKLLLLAGTAEARKIASDLAKEHIPAVGSLAGATRQPAPLAIPTRHGGFGGAVAFEKYLEEHQITAILDATHPFAHAMTTRSAGIAAKLGLGYLQLLRPPWQPAAGDRWTLVRDEQQVADYIPQGATVFLATGRQTLDRFSNLQGRRLICRQIDPPDGPFPFAQGEFLVGRPPFSVADEIALFQELGVDWLVVKNAGGQASKTKLVAARHLQIPVAMIERPASTDIPSVQTISEAMAWVRKLA